MALFPATTAPAVASAAMILPIPVLLVGGAAAWWWLKKRPASGGEAPDYVKAARVHRDQAVADATAAARFTDKHLEAKAHEAANAAYGHVQAIREIQTKAPADARAAIATELSKAERAYKAAVVKWKVVFRGARLGDLGGPRRAGPRPKPRPAPRPAGPANAAPDVEAPAEEAPPEGGTPDVDGFWQ